MRSFPGVLLPSNQEAKYGFPGFIPTNKQTNKQTCEPNTLRRKSRETNLGLIQSTHFTTHFKVLSWGCLSKATCSLFPSTDVGSVSGTGAVYRGQQPGHDGIVGALTGTILVD